MKTKILKTLAVLLCFGVFKTITAQTQEISGGFQNPESVIAIGNKIFVSNMGAKLDPTAKDGDGFISLVSRRSGKVIQEKFITGLNSPKGMKVGWGKLIVTDVDKVLVYNIHTKKKIQEVDLSKEGVTYANDLAVGAGVLLVSSTDNNCIYRVRPGGKVSELLTKVDLPGANGLRRGGGKLFVANYGKDGHPDGSFGTVNRVTKKFTLLQAGGNYDGITKIGKRLVVSDWVNPDENKGRVVVYNLRTKKSHTLDMGRPINGPADLYADRIMRTVYIPAMRENKVLAVSFKSVKQ
jgi:hypothetical protein